MRIFSSLVHCIPCKSLSQNCLSFSYSSFKPSSQFLSPLPAKQKGTISFLSVCLSIVCYSVSLQFQMYYKLTWAKCLNWAVKDHHLASIHPSFIYYQFVHNLLHFNFSVQTLNGILRKRTESKYMYTWSSTKFVFLTWSVNQDCFQGLWLIDSCFKTLLLYRISANLTLKQAQGPLLCLCFLTA